MTDEAITRDMQKALLPMFEFFRDLCEKNGIRYTLAYGTMLGAVRHGGYIPWDDDIDVFITREEYKRLKEVFSHEEYEIVDNETDPSYPYLFPKIRDKNTVLIEKNLSDLGYNTGIYVDLFILDETSKNDRLRRLKLKFHYKLYRLCVLDYAYMGGAARALAKIVRKFTDYKKQIVKCNEVYSKGKGEYLRDITMPDKTLYLRKEETEELTTVQFEGKAYSICKDYDAILTRLYGDYMRLPPEEARISNHSFSELRI